MSYYWELGVGWVGGRRRRRRRRRRTYRLEGLPVEVDGKHGGFEHLFWVGGWVGGRRMRRFE